MRRFFIFAILLIILVSLSILMFIKNPVFGFFTKELAFSFTDNKINLNIKPNLLYLTPKVFEKRVFEVDLTNNRIYFFENGNLKRIIPIAYQAPSGVWYQTPTGYFRAGIKKENHISSLFPVYMNYAVQMYEDFFIHEIPYYLDGRAVTSDFTGGCIRLEKSYAKEFFNLIKSGDLIVSYLTFENLKTKTGFYPPVNIEEFFIRQRFNNPIRALYTFSKDRRIDYIQHAGLDLAPLPFASDLNVYAISDGKIVKIVKNGENDHGLGNTVILEIDRTQTIANRTQTNSGQTNSGNQFGNYSGGSFGNYSGNSKNKKLYVLYGHLAEINPEIKEGDFVKLGQVLGKVGATGYGCNYWRIGEDGCNKNSKLDVHLHLEIKTKPVLESPVEADCNVNGRLVKCYGYTPHNPQNYGYLDPLMFLFEKIR